MQTIHDLQAELAAAGLGRPATGRMLLKLTFLVATAFVLLAAAVQVEPWWLKALLVVAGSWFHVSATMCGHDGSHQAVSPRRWINDLFAWFAFTVLGGLASDYWAVKHNGKHHPFCNVGDKDPDVTQWPFALSREQHVPSAWLWRQFHKVQAWLFYPIVIVFMAPMMRWSGLVHSIVNARRRPHAALDIFFLAAHGALWFLVPPLLGATWLETIALYAATTALGGLYLTLIFSPAHMTVPLVRSYSDWMMLQLATTRNFDTLGFFRFTLIGLDQQIEHHLFPKLSHFDLPRARAIVRAFCERNGLPYTETGWARGLLDTHIRLERAWDAPEIVIGDPPLAQPAAPVASPEPVTV